MGTSLLILGIVIIAVAYILLGWAAAKFMLRKQPIQSTYWIEQPTHEFVALKDELTPEAEAHLLQHPELLDPVPIQVGDEVMLKYIDNYVTGRVFRITKKGRVQIKLTKNGRFTWKSIKDVTVMPL